MEAKSNPLNDVDTANVKCLQPRKIRSSRREIHVSNFRATVLPSSTSLERPRFKNHVGWSRHRHHVSTFYIFYSILILFPNLVSIHSKNQRAR